MYSTTVKCLLFATLVIHVASSTIPVPPGSRYHAALCIMRKEKCYQSNARKSTVCKVGKKPYQQRSICRTRACEFCKLFGSRDRVPCNNDVLKNVCEGERMKRKNKNNTNKSNNSSFKYNSSPNKFKQIPEPIYQTGPPHKNMVDARRCVWTAKSKSIVIDLSRVNRPTRGWSHIRRNKFNGLMYEKNKNYGVDAPSQKGKMCFKVMPKYSGSYFFTAISWSRHVTEHNDCWVSSSKGFNHYQGDNMFTSGPFKWMKAYQNDGPNGKSTSLSTKDHDAHTFVIPDVEEGKVFKVCIAGRSYKYEIFRLALISCGKWDRCINRQVRNLPVSSCI